YVADRAETRSLALWAVHMAGHWHAHIAPDPESGRAWLRGRGSDHTGVRRLASNPPPAPGSLKPMVALKPTPEPFDKAAG
ncbi:MAG TPA: hypothetical protein VHM19_10975, partial [Polyangiales bacterium]|nr:hypothetical protein [Polyangiales bacterium]